MNTSFNIAARSMRIEMIKRGLTRHDLAKMTGLTPGTISNILSGLQAGRFSVVAIEKALGACFLSDHKVSAQSSKLQRILGFDPRIVTIRTLRRAATEHNLPGRAALHKADLIRLLHDHLLPTTKSASKRPVPQNPQKRRARK